MDNAKIVRIYRTRFLLLPWLMLLVPVLFSGCHANNNSELVTTPKICISDYIFQVESAVRDRHNMRVCYSLRKQNGSPIDPEIEFESLSSVPAENAGATVEYQLSTDGKTMWIMEEWSSANEQADGQKYTVTLQNLMAGSENSQTIAEGEWICSFVPELVSDILSLLHNEISFDTASQENFQISCIQLSSIGLFIDMVIPHHDIQKLAEDVSISLICSNKETLELPDKHLYIGAKGNRGYAATCSTTFDEDIDFASVIAILFCDQYIPVNK